MGSTLVVRILILMGGVLAALGLVAGHVNREILDGPSFARHVNEIRTDDDVAALVGQSMSNQIIGANPDLVALRPLVEEVSVRLAGGELLSGPTRSAAEATQQALTEGDADSVALRIVDAGAVASAVLGAVTPDKATAATDVSVTLLSVPDRAVASPTLGIARVIGLLAWVLPLAALACFGLAIALSTARWRTAVSAGRSAVVAAGAVGLLLVVGGFVVRRFDSGEIGVAVAQAAWGSIIRPMWWSVAVVAAAGMAIVLACDPSGPKAMERLAARARAIVLGRPKRRLGVVIRALVGAAVGVAAVADPLSLIEPAIVLGGVVLVFIAISEIARLAPESEPDSLREAKPVMALSAPVTPRRAALVIVAAIVALVGAGVVAQSRPGGEVPEANAGVGTVCNGHADLCERQFNDVAFVATHNSMSAATEPGWFFAEQTDRIPVQLEEGVRVFLIDVWPGRQAGSLVRTAPESYEEALRIAEEELGADVVAAALRVVDSIAGQAEGPEARYLCHNLCAMGSTPFIENLEQIRDWMVANPDEVVTLFIQDETDAASIAADIEAAGLLPTIYQPVSGEPWPTLGDMIRSGKRLIVMLEDQSGGADAPWLINGFEYTQETPFTFPTIEDFTCEPNRGDPDAPLFLLNHWLADYSALVSDAERVNSEDVLLRRAEQCQADRGQLPNFVAVNFSALGDVQEVVDILNGVD